MAARLVRQPLRWFYLWAIIGWLFVAWVVYQSLTPSPIETPSIEFGDKIGHFFAYFLMMTWFAQLYIRSHHLFFLIFFILLGIAMEVLQAQTGYRFFEYGDMVANTGGAFIAWLWAKPGARFANLLLRCERIMLH